MSLLLEQQKIFDAKVFDRTEWQIADLRGQKTRHVSLHVAKAALKLQQSNRTITTAEVIPDLSIYRAQLITTHELPTDMCDDTSYKSRVPSENNVRDQLLAAMGQLAYYLEPEEHGVSDDGVRLTRVANAVTHLHIAAESLGYIYGVDVESAHFQRMQSLLESNASIQGE